jgi:hypothetical protein
VAASRADIAVQDVPYEALKRKLIERGQLLRIGDVPTRATRQKSTKRPTKPKT